MAGDLELEPSLEAACISAVADKIELYIRKYPPRSSKCYHPVQDMGVSGSVMQDAPWNGESFEMECDPPVVAAVEMGAKGDIQLLGRKSNLKMLENIASLKMQCHHDPPCRTSSKQGSKLTASHCDIPDFFIPRPVSEKILKSVCKKGKLTDNVGEFFSDNLRFSLRHLYLKKAGHLTTEGLKRLLGSHTLVEINAEHINEVRQDSPLEVDKERKKITVADIVASVNTTTREKLMSFNITGIPCAKEDWTPIAIYVNAGEFKKLSILTSIRNLNVSYTNFTDNDLNTVIACMKHLRNLDISQTFVRSILYLGDMHAPKLHSLVMNNLDKLNMPKESLFDVLCKMTELRHLDISTEKRMTHRSSGGSVIPNVNIAIGMVMVGGFPLPNLVSLDISGREGIEEVAFLNFYANHTHLNFLGLLLTGLDNLPCFTDERNDNYRTHVKVTGDRTDAQVLESLTRYYKRPFFAKEALFSLFRITQLTPQYNREQLQLVLRCMRNHRLKSDLCASVQMAATACVYNLANREMVLKIPSSILSKVVRETLITMENFQDKQQLQKNCLLTLCSDRILKDVKFDYFKTAKLVMDSLCTNEDAAMHRMSVAIISILAAKISTEQTAILGGSPYMAVLLRIVEQKVNDGNLDDMTLRFTLSALWNLTDESPSTCQNFIDCEGLDLFVKILSVEEESNPCLQTKVLGLLNNLAEVPLLRRHLLRRDMNGIYQLLLHSKHIEVSYFAAGIISHLAMVGSDQWDKLTGETNFRKELLADLYDCVMKWEPPRGEMVAYRTFKPFFPLLQRCDTPAMQLWASWAIRHVCLKNGPKYQEMLIMEQGLECLTSVMKNKNLDAKVREIIESTLTFVSKNSPAPMEMWP